MYQGNEIEVMKRKFAVAFMRDLYNPLDAAIATDPRPQYFQYIFENWQYDAEVQKYMGDIHYAKGPNQLIPSKEDFILSSIKEMNEVKDKETKLKYMRMVAEMLDFIPKPGTNINVNTVKQTVMVLPKYATQDDWENAAMASQGKLINASAQ